MRGLKGKRAIVTGGAQGIGRACVEAFNSYDCSAVFCDLEEDTGSGTERELRETGAEVHFIQGDMFSEAFCSELVEFALEKMAGVDFLVNNAFSFIAAGLDATRGQWQRSLTVGPMAFATMIQLVAEPMKQAGGGYLGMGGEGIGEHSEFPDNQ